MTTTHDTTLIELNIVHVKPRYFFHMMSHVQTITKLYEKAGIKILATWMSEAGATGQMFYITEHKSYASRSKFMDDHMTDPEWIKVTQHTLKFVYYAENFICKANPHIPMKAFSPSKKYLVQMLHQKGFPVFSSTKVWESTQAAEKVIGQHAAHAVAMLHPILNSHQCLIMIRELPDNHVDEALNAYVDAILDPKNWAHMYDTYQHVGRERNVLVRTPPFDKMPKPEGC